MRKGRATALGLCAALFIAAPVSAAEIISSSGQQGIYVVADQVDDQTNLPGARCGYGAENSAGDAFFKWMKFRKPDVYARDTGAGTQQQTVKLIYRLQRNTGSGWKTVASSTQTDSASETDPADFVDRKLYYAARAGELLRGTIEIKWIRAGSVEGKVKLRLEYYSVKWTVGAPDYIYEDACDGSSD